MYLFHYDKIEQDLKANRYQTRFLFAELSFGSFGIQEVEWQIRDNEPKPNQIIRKHISETLNKYLTKSNRISSRTDWMYVKPLLKEFYDFLNLRIQQVTNQFQQDWFPVFDRITTRVFDALKTEGFDIQLDSQQEPNAAKLVCASPLLEALRISYQPLTVRVEFRKKRFQFMEELNRLFSVELVLPALNSSFLDGINTTPQSLCSINDQHDEAYQSKFQVAMNEMIRLHQEAPRFYEWYQQVLLIITNITIEEVQKSGMTYPA